MHAKLFNVLRTRFRSDAAVPINYRCRINPLRTYVANPLKFSGGHPRSIDPAEGTLLLRDYREILMVINYIRANFSLSVVA